MRIVAPASNGNEAPACCGWDSSVLARITRAKLEGLQPVNKGWKLTAAGLKSAQTAFLLDTKTLFGVFTLLAIRAGRPQITEAHVAGGIRRGHDDVVSIRQTLAHLRFKCVEHRSDVPPCFHAALQEFLLLRGLGRESFGPEDWRRSLIASN